MYFPYSFWKNFPKNNLLLWFRTDFEVFTTIAGGYAYASGGGILGELKDQSNNNWSSTLAGNESSTSSNLIYNTNVINGLPTLSFSNASTSNTASFGQGFNNQNPTIATVFVVFQTNANTYQTLFGFNNSLNALALNCYITPSTNNIIYCVNNFESTTFTQGISGSIPNLLNNWGILTLQNSNTNSLIRYNGQTILTTGNLSDYSNLQGYVIGASTNSLPQVGFNGQLSEFIAYSSEIDISQIKTVETYLKHKYAIQY